MSMDEHSIMYCDNNYADDNAIFCKNGIVKRDKEMTLAWMEQFTFGHSRSSMQDRRV
jgi:hypothetical protein